MPLKAESVAGIICAWSVTAFVFYAQADHLVLSPARMVSINLLSDLGVLGKMCLYHSGHKCKDRLVFTFIPQRSLCFSTEWY